ncbi:hypothetical protein ACQPYH_03755 [Kribbella sp. CA-245084]|uniref:hypothetical protein n=1 Tax=Kribbella sp. CA-245084 TaxID=3239940 RepID=UPI003D8A89C6
MSDPQPPAWTPENHPHGAPPPPPGLPQYTARPPQYGGQPPQYGAQPPQYGGPPPQYGAQPPQYGAPPQQPYSQPPKRRTPWVLAGAIAVVIALVGGTVVFLTSRGNDDDAAVGGPMPTVSYSDGVTSSETPSPTSSVPSYTPEPTPTPSATPERRRTLKDVDEGILVYDDVYVKPLSGWTRKQKYKTGVLLADPSKGGVLFVVVDPVGYSAAEAASSVAKGLITGSRMTGVQKEPAKTLRPANSNIGAQAELSFSGRIRTNGVSVSLVGRCTAMTGVESIHTVTVIVCVEARKDTRSAVYRDGTRMLASVARSI